MVARKKIPSALGRGILNGGRKRIMKGGGRGSR
jgi:hypothetical protein